MSWEEVLAATVHLVDLYDSRKEPGLPFNSSTVSSRINKTGNQNLGVFFDIATHALELLDSFEEESPGIYVPIENVLSVLRQTYSSYNDNDFLYVIYKLSTRVPISFTLDNRLIKDTCLIERKASTDRIMLSSKGRIALALSDAAEDWLYADIDADKIIRSITRGNFKQVLKFTISLAQTIKEANINVVKTLELPNKLKRQALYQENEMYSNTASEIQKTALNAQQIMNAPDTIENLEAWIDSNPDDINIGQQIDQKLKQILSMIDVLSRKLSDVIKYAESDNLGSVSIVHFDDIARSFVDSCYIDRAEISLINSGFWKTPLSHGAVYDSITKVIKKVPKQSVEMSFEAKGEIVEKIVAKLIDVFGDSFIEELKNGPISLLDLMQEGRYGSFDIDKIGYLSGVFIDAKSVGFEKGIFMVNMDSEIKVLRSGDMRWRLNDMKLYYYPDRRN